jgi:alpha-galactosidase
VAAGLYALTMLSRRAFVNRTALGLAGLSLPAPLLAALRHTPRVAQTTSAGFLDLRRQPDEVVVQAASADLRLAVAPGGRWEGPGVSLRAIERPDALSLELTAPTLGIKRVGLRWAGRLDDTRLLLGDAWERGYGDLEWRGFVPDRVMPWYVAAWDGTRTHAYGVRTGARAFCSWQVDEHGMVLWADVRSGAAPLELGARVLPVCDVVCRAGQPDESAFAALHAFCRQMCAAPRSPAEPVYGSNDWYYAYGRNSAATVLADAQHIVELSPAGPNRPFVVIDDGWQPGRGASRAGAGTWDHGNEKFPDLPGLTAAVRRAGARPGIWIRPLQAPSDAPDGWRLARGRGALDPTVPDVRARMAADVARLRAWGFALVKHDYSTFDILGQWGYQMGSALTRGTWTFAEGPKRTTAEVIDELYGTIRAAAGDMPIIGCNTVSHLSAGHFEMCRIGDDTSGTDWSRTRKMGVNALAFRGVQHGAFYTADPDCVGVTTAVPWAYNRRWLDLLARSGTMLFVSLAPDALGADERRDLRAALALAAQPQPLGEPLDWQQTSCPTHWRLMGADREYDWGDLLGHPVA